MNKKLLLASLTFFTFIRASEDSPERHPEPLHSMLQEMGQRENPDVFMLHYTEMSLNKLIEQSEEKKEEMEKLFHKGPYGALTCLPKPEYFTPFTSLKTLELSHMYIGTVPTGSFAELPQLERLSLRNNQIRSLKDGAFKGMVALQSLSLRENKLKEINVNAFDNHPELYHMNIQDNELEDFPEALIEKLPKLRQLTIKNNKMSDERESDIEDLLTPRIHEM